MKKTALAVALLFSTGCFSSPIKIISQFSEKCYDEVSVQISITLAQAHHVTESNSPEERLAKKALNSFTDRNNWYKASLTGCNEEFEGDERSLCHAQVYSAEVKRYINNYEAAKEIVGQTPVCAYLSAALVEENSSN
jgi:hypothetical protein